jgi:alkylation response protein AidB-like acyl-CoA dehydrogenase
VDLLLTPEQDEIASSAAAFLASDFPRAGARAHIGHPSNVDRKAWRRAAELGWFGLGLAEAEGGSGAGLAEEAIVFREVGRALAAGPWLATVLGARVASFAGDAGLTSAIVSGAPVGLIVGGQSPHGGIQVLDGAGADLALLATPRVATLHRVDALGPLEPVDCLDPTTRLATSAVGPGQAVASVAAETDPVWRRGVVLLAAAQAGIAAAVRDLAAAHAKERIQFDRPIGVHQAVKHPCADMAVQAELAWAQTIVAALAVDEDLEDAEFQALSAKVVAGRAACQGAGATIQVLGGMGFTFEHDANLFLKRAFVLDRLLGDERETLDRLLTLPAAR